MLSILCPYDFVDTVASVAQAIRLKHNSAAILFIVKPFSTDSASACECEGVAFGYVSVTVYRAAKVRVVANKTGVSVYVVFYARKTVGCDCHGCISSRVCVV